MTGVARARRAFIAFSLALFGLGWSGSGAASLGLYRLFLIRDICTPLRCKREEKDYLKQQVADRSKNGKEEDTYTLRT